MMLPDVRIGAVFLVNDGTLSLPLFPITLGICGVRLLASASTLKVNFTVSKS